MNAIMISINPKWCELIVNGQKTIEVRKTRPNIKTPFKCYIYCTKDRKNLLPIEHGKVLDKVDFWENIDAYYGFGKVIGEFMCDRIDELPCGVNQPFWLKEKTCIDNEHYKNYLGNKNGYGWYISDLKIYDEPKELEEFIKPCPFYKNANCPQCEFYSDYFGDCRNIVTRIPYGWCYVEEL